MQSGNALTPLKILGPAYGATGITTLTFTGGSLDNPSYWIISNSGGGTGIINVSGGSIVTRDLVMAKVGGTALLNISGGSVEVYGTGSGLGLVVPGDTNDSKAVIKITGGELYADQLTLYDDGLINIVGSGVMKLPGNQTSLINAQISEGRIIAEHGNKPVTVSYNGTDTVLTSPGGSTPTHAVVAHHDNYFYAWPANEGAWSWGNSNEIGRRLQPSNLSI